MNYFHPSRPRLPNGLPCWLTAPTIALPRVVIEPITHFGYRLGFIINGAFKWRTTFIEKIPDVLTEWTNDPEGFIAFYFSTHQSSVSEEAHTTTSALSLEDLGL